MRYRSRSGHVALDLDDDGTFTLWTFDESEPYLQIWVTHEGQVSRGAGALALVAETSTRRDPRLVDPPSPEPYRGTFAVTLVHDRPVELHAFGECHPLQPA